MSIPLCCHAVDLIPSGHISERFEISTHFMMTSWNRNIFRVTGHLCGEFTGPRWIPRTKAQWRRALMLSLICVWINGWVNNRETGDLKSHRDHYDVIVMSWKIFMAIQAYRVHKTLHLMQWKTILPDDILINARFAYTLYHISVLPASIGRVKYNPFGFESNLCLYTRNFAVGIAITNWLRQWQKKMVYR